MNKNQKYSELLSFVCRVAKLKCTDPDECLSCDAIDLLRRVTYKEDMAMDIEENE